MKKLSLLLLSSVAALVGCQDREVSVAQTPHPLDGAPPPAQAVVAQQELPPGHPPIAQGQMPAQGQMASGQQSMRSQSLPSGSVSQAGTPQWQVPETWAAGPQSSVRKGSFAAGSNGEIDISVTAFPGDVGGMLQNVNRWRQQIGLMPVGPQDLEGLVSPLPVDGKGGFLISLEGEVQSTLAVSVMHQGTSWFFKMTGPSEAVKQETDPFIAFVESVVFP